MTPQDTITAPEAELEAAAVRLALDNASGDDAIRKVYWFPDDRQIRLVEVDEFSIREEGEIRPIYFAPVKDSPFPGNALRRGRPETSREDACGRAAARSVRVADRGLHAVLS